MNDEKYMKKIITGSLATFGIAASALAALAAPPDLVSNPGSENADRSNNCIAYYSAMWIHNGQAETLGQGGNPSHGTRGDEIKQLQDICGGQSK